MHKDLFRERTGRDARRRFAAWPYKVRAAPGRLIAMADSDLSVDWGLSAPSDDVALEHAPAVPLQYVALYEQCQPAGGRVDAARLADVLEQQLRLPRARVAQILAAVGEPVDAQRFYWALAQAAMIQHAPDHDVPGSVGELGIALELHTDGGSDSEPAPAAPPAPVPAYVPTAPPTLRVSVCAQPAGAFLLRHTEFEVVGAFRDATVRARRRYRDFVWLHDCLVARYPFRAVPVLPPKVFSINGTFLTSGTQAQFLDKRAQSLTRFLQLLVAHPVLAKDALVALFVTTPDAAFASDKGKFKRLEAADELVATPLFIANFSESTLDEWKQRDAACAAGATHATMLASFLEHEVARAMEQRAALELVRGGCAKLAQTLPALYPSPNEDKPVIAGNLKRAGKLADKWAESSRLEILKVRVGAVYELKLFRDMLTSVRMLFQRQRARGTNSIPELKRKIEGFERRLRTLDEPGAAKPEQREETRATLRTAVQQAQEQIAEQRARDMNMKMIITQELQLAEATVYQLSVFLRTLAQNLVGVFGLDADFAQQFSDLVADSPVRYE